MAATPWLWAYRLRERTHCLHAVLSRATSDSKRPPRDRPRRPLTCGDAGGRYWDRTSDLFRVRDLCHARARCSERHRSVAAFTARRPGSGALTSSSTSRAGPRAHRVVRHFCLRQVSLRVQGRPACSAVPADTCSSTASYTPVVGQSVTQRVARCRDSMSLAARAPAGEGTP